MKDYNKNNIHFAKDLRKSMTPWENRLWYQFLRGYPLRFQRQKCIGNYIADFYCAKAGIVVELDGGGHYEPEQKLKDEARTKELCSLNLKVLRFTNLDVDNNFAHVCEHIDEEVKKSLPQSPAATAPYQGISSTNKIKDFGCHLSSEGAICLSKEKTMKQVTIYTDGACSGNPGPGGWGAILEYKGVRRELSGGESKTTNNRMELTGAIRALEALKESCIVELYSDSKYLIDGLSKGWAESWRKKGWIKSDKKPALNPDLWGTLLDLCAQHEMHYHWVKGHAENPWNNRCDELAVQQRDKFAK